jgi:hypothetical protein
MQETGRTTADEHGATDQPGLEGRRFGRASLWSTIALLPFLAFPLSHYVTFGADATGLTTYDLPYYAANARALVERGQGGLYPNAFDHDPAAPAIYFHWLISLIAFLTRGLGVDPGLALQLVGVLAGWVASRLMFSLVETLLHERRWIVPLYLSTMWGGGLLVAASIATNIVQGQAIGHAVLAFDPGQGLWCLNFGRNLIMPTEAVYHALMIALWLSLLRGCWRAAAICLWLIVTTHPFTGAQALAIVGAYIAIDRACAIQKARTACHGSVSRAIRDAILHGNRRDTGSSASPPLSFIASSVAAALAFAGYYFAFLPGYPQHRELQTTWTLGWTLTVPMILLAYSPAAIAAGVAVTRDPLWRSRCRFLLTAAAVSFLLANHQLFMTPRQPIHFTRGYIWTPLWLAGLPVLAQLLTWGTQVQRRWPSVVVAALGVVVVSDNAGFLATSSVHARDYGFGLNATERSAFNAISKLDPPRVLLTDDERLGYLAAVYTPARPWFGHKYNTPRFDDRKRLAGQLAQGSDAQIPPDVDVILTQSAPFCTRLYAEGWSEIGRFDALVLWRRSAGFDRLAHGSTD